VVVPQIASSFAGVRISHPALLNGVFDSPIVSAGTQTPTLQFFNIPLAPNGTLITVSISAVFSAFKTDGQDRNPYLIGIIEPISIKYVTSLNSPIQPYSYQRLGTGYDPILPYRCFFRSKVHVRVVLTLHGFLSC
jgi:hypothetical protein